MKKQLLITLLGISLTTATFAYEKVEGGIQFGKIVYPTELTSEQLSEIDKQFPSLIDFLLSSEAINDQEKPAWLAILPKMSQEKRQKLYDILLTERRQLEALVQKYEEETKKLAEAAKHPPQQSAYLGETGQLEPSKTDNCSGEWRYVLPKGLYAYLGNIRMSKEDRSNTITLSRGTKVCVIGESYPPQGSEYSEPWSKIIYNDQYWWVSSGYLVSNRVVFSDCDNFSRVFTVIDASSLNVMKDIENLNNSHIIGVVEEGSKVCPIDYKLIDQSGWSNNWVKIRLTNGDTGWVAKKYLQAN